MVSFSAKFWHNHFESTLFCELNKVVEVMQERILPQFASIAAEADAIQSQTWNELSSAPSDGDDDPSDLIDAAFNAGHEHYSLMTGLRQGVVNLFAVSLFHLHEQYLLIFYKRQLRDPREKLDPRRLKPPEVVRHLGRLGIMVKELPSWHRLKEYEALANAIKHGDGESAQFLREKRPEFFNDPELSPHLNFGTSVHVDKPLFGEGIYVTQSHLGEIKDVIIGFWNELFIQLGANERAS